MAGFFERMSAAMRGNEGGYSVPEFLRTHPVNITRISEAKARAEQMKKDTVLLTTSTPTGERKERVDPADPSLAEPLLRGNNPLLPSSVLRLPIGQLNRGASGDFDWARERLRVLSAIPPRAGTRVCRPGQAAEGRSQRCAALRPGAGGHARWPQWVPAGPADPGQPAADPSRQPVAGAGPGRSRIAGRPGAQANSRFEQLLREHPNSRPVALTYAEILNEQGTREAGQRAQAMLRPCCRKVVTIRSSSSATPAPASWPATACAPARPMPRPPSSAAARSRRCCSCRPLKRNPALDYIGRARVDARIEAITPTVLELRRQGVQDPDLDRR
jgi:predicted Zn-dependent protease